MESWSSSVAGLDPVVVGETKIGLIDLEYFFPLRVTNDLIRLCSVQPQLEHLLVVIKTSSRATTAITNNREPTNR